MLTFFTVSFWVCFALIFYTYIGYGIVLFFLIRIKRIFKTRPKHTVKSDQLPEVTVLVAAYNEADFIEDKIKNSLEFNYPKDKLKYIFVSDGSDDNTPGLIKKYPAIQIFITLSRNSS